jgi:hypothetical protein
MVIDMNDTKLVTLEKLRGFLAGAADPGLTVVSVPAARYGLIKGVLKRFKDPLLGKADRGVVRRYLCRVTGYLHPQLTRLIAQYLRSGCLVRRYRVNPSSYIRQFTPQDVLLLAELDSLHATLSGPATRVLLARAYHLFGQPAYARLATISVSHLYNLRAQPLYQQQHVHYSKTQTRPSTLGVRRRPKAGPGSSASTRSTRATTTGARVCIKSMPSTSSPSGKWSPPASASARRTCYW